MADEALDQAPKAAAISVVDRARMAATRAARAAEAPTPRLVAAARRHSRVEVRAEAEAGVG